MAQLIPLTNRLIIRNWQESDIIPMSVINQDKAVMEFYPSLQNLEETKNFIQNQIIHLKEHGFCFYALELKETGELIGFTGLYKTSFKAHFTPSTEIGWRLSKKYWGKGYATEAAKACLEHGLNILKLKEIVSFTTITNTKSENIMKKLNMTNTPQDNFKHPNLPKNHPLSDHILYYIKK